VYFLHGPPDTGPPDGALFCLCILLCLEIQNLKYQSLLLTIMAKFGCRLA